MKKNRRMIWGFELRQFTFWISVVIVGGTIPDLLAIFGNWVLFSGWGIAAVVAFYLWRKMYRKSGVGIFVHMPQKGADDAKEGNLHIVNGEMSERHLDWFIAGPENPAYANDATRRAKWMVTTVQHHLNKMRFNLAAHSTVYFYLYSRLEDAFTMGVQFAKEFRGDAHGLPDLNGESFGDWKISPIVRYLATRGQNSGIYEIDISELNGPNTSDLTKNITESKHDLHKLNTENDIPSTARMAILIHVRDEETASTDTADAGQQDKLDRQHANRGHVELYSPHYRRLFIEAASGQVSNGYDMREDDVCDKALTFSVTATFLTELLKNGNGHEFLKHLNTKRISAAQTWYGNDKIPVRLFLKGPAIVAFAAGILLPPFSRLVPWNGDMSPRADSHHTPSIANNPELVAIVDGDDIGSPMEARLLSGELKSAISYSESISSELYSAFRELAETPGVELLSSEGDSAVFGLESVSFEIFQSKLDEIRVKNSLSLSCGWGTDSRSAFMGLRVSKTSGKNMTSRGF